jgi:hypothetical protein
MNKCFDDKISRENKHSGGKYQVNLLQKATDYLRN